jgi:hypothetical protein
MNTYESLGSHGDENVEYDWTIWYHSPEHCNLQDEYKSKHSASATLHTQSSSVSCFQIGSFSLTK